MGPRFFVGYKFLATCKKSERQRDREMTEQTDYTFQRTIALHPGLIKQTEIIIVAEKTFYANPGSITSNPYNFWHETF